MSRPENPPAEWIVEELLPEDDGPGRLVRLSLTTYGAASLRPGDVLTVKPKDPAREEKV